MCRGKGCLSSVGTYLLGTLLQEWRLLKQYGNIPTGHFIAGVQAVQAVLKPTCRAMCCSGVGCLSGVETYLPSTVLKGLLEPICRALCCRGAGYLSGV